MYQSRSFYWLLWLQIHISSSVFLTSSSMGISSPSKRLCLKLTFAPQATSKPQLIPSQPVLSPLPLARAKNTNPILPIICLSHQVPPKMLRIWGLLHHRLSNLIKHSTADCRCCSSEHQISFYLGSSLYCFKI